MDEVERAQTRLLSLEREKVCSIRFEHIFIVKLNNSVALIDFLSIDNAVVHFYF